MKSTLSRLFLFPSVAKLSNGGFGGDQPQRFNPRGRGGGGSGGAGPYRNPYQPGGQTTSSTLKGPVKDKFPSALVNLSDPRRRLAVLIDSRNTLMLDPSATSSSSASASSSSSSSADQTTSKVRYPPLSSSVIQSIERVGVPVLFRVFAQVHELPSVWQPHCQPWHQFNAASPEVALLHQRAFQLFPVEPFIPISMQMEADAEHLFRYREHNAVEGVCYLIKGTDREAWKERLRIIAEQWSKVKLYPMEENNPTVTFFNQYLVDEMGIVASQCADGRSENGE